MTSGPLFATAFCFSASWLSLHKSGSGSTLPYPSNGCFGIEEASLPASQLVGLWPQTAELIPFTKGVEPSYSDKLRFGISASFVELGCFGIDMSLFRASELLPDLRSLVTLLLSAFLVSSSIWSVAKQPSSKS